MIDTHCHILPGLDDGAQNLEQFLAMTEIAVQDGIRIIIATPHVMAGAYDNSKEEIISAVQQVNTILTEKEIPLKILPGAEYHIEPDLPRRMKQGELLTLNNNGRYLLVEFPSAYIPSYTERILYELQLWGVTPVIAHPERNTAFAKKPSLLAQFVAKGMPTQVTAGSLTGSFGRQIQKTALSFIKQSLVHMIVSDAHSSKARRPVLSSAAAVVKKHFSEEVASKMVKDNPKSISSGNSINLAEQKIRKNWSSIITNLFPQRKA